MLAKSAQERDDDSEEEKDDIAALNAIPSHLQKMTLSDPKISMHTNHIPVPKPNSSKANGKFDPAPWSEYFDTMEKVNDVVPFYYAGT